jgi:glycosyltransferase involved in cell wall biosynthesis
VYLSRELTKLGYCVRIYGNPPPEELGVDQDGVVWLPFWAFSMWHAPDVAVLWRNMDSVWLAPRASRRYVWVHDPLALASDQHYFTDKFLRALAGIFVLSNHSRSQFPREAQGKLILSNNGLPPHLLRDGNNAHNKLLYASWPSSGLEQVLRQWPTIRAAAAAAELHVYGGFDWWWATPLYEKEAWFVEWRAVMEELLRQDGVIYWGGVGHQRMAEAYAETGFYVYPTETPETAPINLIKAQANGCIPITSRFAASAIAETTGAFDLGPPARAGSIKDDADWLDEWTAAVIKAIHTPQEELADHRRLMKQRARETYSWPKVAAAWDRAFHA